MTVSATVMDVFEAQRRARWSSLLLLTLWALFAVSLVIPAYVVVWLLSHGWPFETPTPGVDAPALDPPLALVTTAVVLGAVVAGSAYQWIRLRRGGDVVARLLGGRPIPDDPSDPAHRRFRNVAEEVAIAAGAPVPGLFVLPAEPGINALAAGLDPGDAAIAVTGGALERLTREELQAVVAHELAHIVQGDTRLRTRSLALLHGLLFVGLAGAALTGGSLVRRGRPGLLLFLGFGLTVAGGLGVGLGRLLQGAAGRQREYLADARGAQYTRAPAALASALRKTGGDSAAAEIRHHYRMEVRHLFFSAGLADAGGMLRATHPPLGERIRRLDPEWDGSFTHTRLAADSTTAVIAAALRRGGETTIRDEPISGAELQGKPAVSRRLKGPIEAIAALHGAPRRASAPAFEVRKRPPTVRLPPTDSPDTLGGSDARVPPSDWIHSFLPVGGAVRRVLAAASAAAGGDEVAIRVAVEEALDALPGVSAGNVVHEGDVPDARDVDRSLAELARLSPGMRGRFLDACAFAVHREGTTTPEAARLVRRAARRLGIDLPPSFGV